MSEDYRMSLLAERRDAELEADDFEDDLDEPVENYYTEMHRWLSERLSRIN